MVQQLACRGWHRGNRKEELLTEEGSLVQEDPTCRRATKPCTAATELVF